MSICKYFAPALRCHRTERNRYELITARSLTLVVSVKVLSDWIICQPIGGVYDDQVTRYFNRKILEGVLGVCVIAMLCGRLLTLAACSG